MNIDDETMFDKLFRAVVRDLLRNLLHAAHDGGWLLGLVGIIIASASFYVHLPQSLGAPEVDADKVPTTGEQGYPVLEFCQDPATTVERMIHPPDSTFEASYTLDRRKGNPPVHETIDVSVYADREKQPVAIHHDSKNVPADGFVSKDAVKCIESKAK